MFESINNIACVIFLLFVLHSTHPIALTIHVF